MADRTSMQGGREGTPVRSANSDPAIPQRAPRLDDATGRGRANLLRQGRAPRLRPQPAKSRFAQSGPLGEAEATSRVDGGRSPDPAARAQTTPRAGRAPHRSDRTSARVSKPQASQPSEDGHLEASADRTAGRRHSLARSGAPLAVVVFLLLTVLVPVEFGFSIGGLFFTWSKAYMFFASVIILPLAAMRLKLETFDWLMIAHVAWSGLAYLVMYGPGAGLEKAGTYVVDFLSVYLLARLCLRSAHDVAMTLRVLLLLVVPITALAIPEALLGQRFVHEFAQSITGQWYNFSDETRFGMLRAASTFAHPILFGMFCAALVSAVWFVSRSTTRRFVMLGLLGTGTFFSLSSAPLLVFVGQIGLIVLERTTRWLKKRVTLFALGFVALIIALELFTGRGAIGVLTLVMLNPATAWYRKAQIEYSFDDILRHPLFGLGDQLYTRPDWLSASIDNHFLFLAIRSGIPAVLFLVLTVVFIWRHLKRVDAGLEPPIFERLRLGWGLMMVGLMLGAATVTYFGSMLPLLAFYIAMGASLAASASAASAVSVSAPALARASAPSKASAALGAGGSGEAGPAARALGRADATHGPDGKRSGFGAGARPNSALRLHESAVSLDAPARVDARALGGQAEPTVPPETARDDRDRR